jgi:hypothetical protein
MSHASLSTPYCTLPEAQAEAQNNDPTEAADFIKAINNASRWIDSFCRRDFLYHNHSSTALQIPNHWSAGNTIYLPWPIITLTEITVTIPNVEVLVVDPLDYQFENSLFTASAKIHRSMRWIRAGAFYGSGQRRLPPKISLRGTFGCAPVIVSSVADYTQPSASIPPDVRQACVLIAAVRSGRMRREIVDVTGQSRSVLLRNTPKEATDTLERYRAGII